MAVICPQLVTRAKILADMLGSRFLLDNEWNDLISDAVRAMWLDVVGVNKDFRNKTLSFTVSSTAANFVDLATLAPDFAEVRSVWINYGTQSQRRLNKLDVNNGSTQCELSYRLENTRLYIEPQFNALGAFTLIYTPSAPAFDPDFVVRVSRGRDLPDCTQAGAGVGKTITASANGALPLQDGVNLVVQDRFLIVEPDVNSNLTAVDFGIYRVVSLGSAGSKWQLVRVTDYDVASLTEVHAGAVIAATEGTANANVPYTLLAFTGPVDTGQQNYTVAALDLELEPHQEYVILYAAIRALLKEESTEQAASYQDKLDPDGQGKQGVRGKLMRWASDQRTADPEQVVDVRGSRRRRGIWSFE